MTTNTFFRKITLFLICISGLIGCSGSEKNQPFDQATQRPPEKIYKWKMVTTWPKNLPGLGLAAENFSILASKMSGGRLQIKVYGAGQLVPALETFDAVSQGTAEMGHGSAYYWKGKNTNGRPVYYGAFWPQCARNEQLAALWWRYGAMERAIRAV